MESHNRELPIIMCTPQKVYLRIASTFCLVSTIDIFVCSANIKHMNRLQGAMKGKHCNRLLNLKLWYTDRLILTVDYNEDRSGSSRSNIIYGSEVRYNDHVCEVKTISYFDRATNESLSMEYGSITRLVQKRRG